MKSGWYGIIITFFLIFISGCGTTGNAQEEQSSGQSESALYSNEKYGIVIENLTDWSLEEEFNEEKLNVKFTNGQTKAIITALSTKKTFEEIKNELKYGSGNVDVITDNENYVSFESKRKDKTTTDIYLKKQNDHTYVYTFMTPTSEYSQAKLKIGTFIEKINIE